MGNPFQGFPPPPGPVRERETRTRQTRRGIKTDFGVLSLDDPLGGVRERETRSGPPLDCGHIVSKSTPYLGTCTICGISEFCARCQLECARCQRVGFRCCLVLYRADDETEHYYCEPCRNIVRRRRVLGVIGDAIKQPFVAEDDHDE